MVSRIIFGRLKADPPLPGVAGVIVWVDMRLGFVVVREVMGGVQLGENLEVRRKGVAVGIVKKTKMADEDHWVANLIKGDIKKGDTIGRIQVAERRALPGGFCLLTLRPRGKVTLRLLSWGDDALEVESPAFGKVKMLPAAVGAVNFK